MADLTEQEKQRRKRMRLLALMIFMPQVKLKRQIHSASNTIFDHFDEVRDGFDNHGDEVAAVKQAKSLHHPLIKLAEAAVMMGFVDGARLTGRNADLFTTRSKRVADARGQEVADQMNGTTMKMLKESKSSDGHVLSKDRANKVARYEAAKNYYDGVMAAFAGTKEWGKEWLTTSDDPCDECLDNEDEGLIPMDELFQSGHYAPLLHLHCECFLGIRKL